MEINCDFTSPEQVLHAFWTAMNHWEVEAYRSMPRVDDFDAMSRYWPRIAEERASIFAVYCTPKKRVLSERPSVGSPPAYDPLKQRVVEITQPSSSRAEVQTEDTSGPPRSFTYILLKKGGKWLIDSKQYIGWNGKVVKGAL